MEFLHMVIEHLTEKGVMDPGLLDASSFVDMTPKDPQQAFNFEKTKRVIRGLNGSAAGCDRIQHGANPILAECEVNVHNAVMSKILYIVTPTNWDELSGEEKDEFDERFFIEYFRLYEERIGPFPGPRSKATRLQKDNQAADTAARQRTRPDVSRLDPQK